MRIQITKKTVSEAIDEALIKLDATIDEIEHKVLQEPSKGFLGIGTKPAIIEVWRIDDEEEKPQQPKEEPKAEVKKEYKEEKTYQVKKEAEEFKPKRELKERTTDPCLVAEKFLKEVFSAMKLEVEIDAQLVDNKYLNINLKGENMGVIIGKRGQTLDSLQYLVNLTVNKGESPYISVSLDTEDYRKRRKETLETLAFNLAKKAKHFRKNVVLEPMNPYERRIIHSTLQNDRYVTTYSEGEEPFRYVVIAPKSRY